jgi:hypothetical protein
VPCCPANPLASSFAPRASSHRSRDASLFCAANISLVRFKLHGPKSSPNGSVASRPDGPSRRARPCGRSFTASHRISSPHVSLLRPRNGVTSSRAAR